MKYNFHSLTNYTQKISQCIFLPYLNAVVGINKEYKLCVRCYNLEVWGRNSDLRMQNTANENMIRVWNLLKECCVFQCVRHFLNFDYCLSIQHLSWDFHFLTKYLISCKWIFENSALWLLCCEFCHILSEGSMKHTYSE